MDIVLPKNFNYIFYANYYKDLYLAFGYDKKKLENHYFYHGQFENRKYCNIDDNFNWQKFLLDNKDGFKTIDKYTKENAIDYYLNNYKNSNDYDNDNDKPICLLYYIYLNPSKDWRIILTGQLQDIHKTQILNKSLFHTVLCGSKSDIDEAKSIIRSLIDIEFDTTEVHENKYEFPAIIKIRELALLYPNKVFIYIHSKGMVYNNHSSNRLPLEKALTNCTLLNWETTLNIFHMFPNIQKAALLPSNEGVGLFNFWWARGSYLISCKPIQILPNLNIIDRFQCEYWLGLSGDNSPDNFYCIINKNTKTRFNAEEGCKYIDNIIHQFQYT